MTKDIHARCSSAYSISLPSQVLGAKFAYIILGWYSTGSCTAFHKVNNNGTSSLHLSPRSPPYRLDGQNHFHSSLSQLPACTLSPYLPLRSALPSLLSLSLSLCRRRRGEAWLQPWPRRSRAAGGWRWRRWWRTCCSRPCCWAGARCSSCSSRRASTPTCATRKRVSGDSGLCCDRTDIFLWLDSTENEEVFCVIFFALIVRFEV